jgi:hypothetical protein
MTRWLAPLTLTLFFLGGFALATDEPPEMQLEFAKKLRDKKLTQYALEVLEKLNKNPAPGMDKTVQLELARTQIMVARLLEPEQREPALEIARQRLDPLAKMPATPEGAEALLERARVVVLLGQMAGQLARRADDPQSAADLVAKAEKFFQNAQKEFTDAEQALPAARDKCQARFERSLVFYQQSTLYFDAKPAAKRKKAELISEARKVLESTLKDYGSDTKNPTVHLAMAWLARCCREGGERNLSEKHYKELLADKQPEAAAGQRWAKAFLLASIPLDKNGIQMVQKAAIAWLSAYGDFHDTPEGALVRYYLATSYVLAAQGISKDVHHPEAAKLYDLAQREFAAVALLDSEYAERAEEYGLNVRFMQIGEKTPLESLKNFDDCYLKGRYEMGLLQDLTARQAKAKTQEQRDQLGQQRKTQVQTCIAAYERAVSLSNKSTSPQRLAEVHFLLAYCYLANGEALKALESSKKLAMADPPTKRSAPAAAYALEVCAVLLAKDDAPKTHKAVRELAEFILKKRKDLWGNDPVTQTAHYQLAMVALVEKQYAEAAAELEQMRPDFRNYFHSRCQLVFILLAARGEARDDDAKKQLADKATAVLKALPPLPKLAEGETAGLFFSAQIELGNVFLEEAAVLLEAKKMPEAKAKYQDVVRHSDQVKKEVVKLDKVVDGGVRDRIIKALDQLKLFGQLGVTRLEYREGNFDKVLTDTAPLLADVLARGKDEKSTEPIKVKDIRLIGNALGLALRAHVQKGNVAQARTLVLVLRRLTDEQGSESVAVDVLTGVVQELKFQMREHKADKDALQALIAKFSNFLDVLGKEVDPKMFTDRQFVIFLASSYAGLDKHAESAKLFAQVQKPSFDPKKKLSEKEQQELQDYWLIQGMYARSLRISKQLPEARKVLEKILKDPKAVGRFQAEKEMNHLLEDEGEWGQAVTSWSEFMENRGLRGTLVNPKATPADKQYAKELYFDGFYHYILCNYKYGFLHKDKEKKAQFIARAASLIRGLETVKSQDGWNLVGPQLVELMRNEPELKAAYDKLKTK